MHEERLRKIEILSLAGSVLVTVDLALTDFGGTARNLVTSALEVQSCYVRLFSSQGELFDHDMLCERMGLEELSLQVVLVPIVDIEEDQL